jgi:DNA-binding response OmpR family regulator
MPQEKHILVVDDEPGIQNFIRRNLELRAFKVSLANNGLEALALFEQTNFALIILDIMMPRMDGLEVCRRIRHAALCLSSFSLHLAKKPTKSPR